MESKEENEPGDGGKKGGRSARWRAGFSFLLGVQRAYRRRMDPRIRGPVPRWRRKGIEGSWMKKGRRGERGLARGAGKKRDRKKKSHPPWRLKAMRNQRPVSKGRAAPRLRPSRFCCVHQVHQPFYGSFCRLLNNFASLVAARAPRHHHFSNLFLRMLVSRNCLGPLDVSYHRILILCSDARCARCHASRGIKSIVLRPRIRLTISVLFEGEFYSPIKTVAILISVLPLCYATAFTEDSSYLEPMLHR